MLKLPYHKNGVIILSILNYWTLRILHQLKLNNKLYNHNMTVLANPTVVPHSKTYCSKTELLTLPLGSEPCILNYMSQNDANCN